MKGWSKQSGVDQKKTEALARGVAKTPEWATNAYEAIRKKVASATKPKSDTPNPR